MSTDQNKSTVRRYIGDVWGKGQTSLLPQLVSSDICDHAPVPGQPRGLDGQRWVVDYFRSAAPDMQITIEHLIAQGDFVADHWRCSGTHTGELFGIQPTGKRFNITGSDMSRLESGKIAEVWHVEDTLTLMRELGAVPAPPQTAGSAGRASTTGPNGGAGRGRTLSDDETRVRIKEGYRQFIDRANLADVDRLLAPDFVGHFSGFPPVRGRDEFRQFLTMWNRALSPNHASVEDILIDGDLAACRITYSGKHTGELMGIAPSGKQVVVTSLALFRFSGDQVAEQWANSEDLGLLQQIGAVPVTAEYEVASPC